MSSPQRVSDTEGSEKPVRERLRTTSIAAPKTRSVTAQEASSSEDAAKLLPTDDAHAESSSTGPSEDDKRRGRPSRKRSHEDITDPAQGEPAEKSRHGRKRSRETLDEDKEDASPKRKTSGDHQRDSTAMNGNGEDASASKRHVSTNKRPATTTTDNDPSDAAEVVTSPKTKKSRPAPSKTDSAPAVSTSDPEPSTADDNPDLDTAAQQPETATTEQKTGVTLYAKDDEGKTKSNTSAIPASSGFANASTSSPFSSLAGAKSPTDQQTSTSAFQSSGFGALAGSSTSGFGSLAGGPSKLSSFGSGGATPPTATADTGKSENEKPASKTFGGALGASSAFAAAGTGSTSAFAGAGATGFGTIGKSGFGSALGGGSLGGGFGGLGGASKLGSFASSGTPGVIGSAAKSVKPFGAPAAADDEEADEGSGADENDGADAAVKADEDEKDERFFERDIETGEENETTEYTCRAKLYNFVKAEDGVKKEWKERGLGVVRLNVANPAAGSEDTAPKARLVMRADGSHRVALNTPIVKGVKFGSVTGDAPSGGYMYFMGSIDGSAKLELLQMKLRPQFALELHDRIVDLQKAM